jgi:hypothetical protein
MFKLAAEFEREYSRISAGTFPVMKVAHADSDVVRHV